MTPPGIYRHFKGGYYAVFGRAFSAADETVQTIYQCLYGDYAYWIRAESEFNEMVEREGVRVRRFSYCRELPKTWVCYGPRDPAKVEPLLEEIDALDGRGSVKQNAGASQAS